MMNANEPIRIGAIGLGRLGAQHAANLATKIAGAQLHALCDMDEPKLKQTAAALGVPHVFSSYEEMIALEGLDAVVITSPSGLHTKQIVQAMDRGLHVFSEKPLGTNLEECLDAEAAVARHPELTFMLGFMRRFDPSYMDAKARIESGEIGRPILFRGYSQDPETAIAGAIAYAGHSGGQFIDMAVHDIDLARWLLSSEPVSVYAIGGCYAHPEFGQYKDGDNVGALLKFESDAMAFLFAGRTAPHGYNVETEIVGTKGTLRIAAIPQRNHLEILDAHGVRRECSQNFLERFEAAYLEELRVFVHCIRTGERPGVLVQDGTQTTRIAYKCRESFESGELVRI